ncbi:Na(+)/drug antiporter [Gammaproteobacteria bacterium MOLA455]|nr:Na(+)/drug antiporter [Gammaproteobacteria bacterium MOLA455]
MFHTIKSRWHSPGGYKDVLVLAIPLVITTSAGSLQSFIDRVFLSWFDSNALAATVPAAMVSMSFTAVFLGLASYVGVFVAQNYGAREHARIGAVVWQGFYTIALSLPVVIPIYLYIVPLFQLIGHDPILQVMEADYARVIILTIPIAILSASLSGFFSGIGRTSVVMWSNLLITVLNIVLDYGLIFGHLGLPQMGVQGAAWATFIALSAGTAAQLWVFFMPRYRHSYNSLSHWRFDWYLFRRLLRFGLPVGFQAQLQMLAWTLFVLLIGKIGVAALTAHSIAMNVFMLMVMPVMGMSIAVSILAGQRLGAEDPDSAERVTYSAIHLSLLFFVVAGLLLVTQPNWFIAPFVQGMTSQVYANTIPLVKDLLTVVAIFCVFEAISMMMAGALKGAGDTRFVAWASILSSWLVLVFPTALLAYFWHGNLLWSWLFFLLSGFTMCLAHWLRFRAAKWKLLRLAT